MKAIFYHFLVNPFGWVKYCYKLCEFLHWFCFSSYFLLDQKVTKNQEYNNGMGFSEMPRIIDRLLYSFWKPHFIIIYLKFLLIRNILRIYKICQLCWSARNYAIHYLRYPLIWIIFDWVSWFGKIWNTLPKFFHFGKVSNENYNLLINYYLCYQILQ